jgi:hypothetical protein
MPCPSSVKILGCVASTGMMPTRRDIDNRGDGLHHASAEGRCFYINIQRCNRRRWLVEVEVVKGGKVHTRG